MQQNSPIFPKFRMAGDSIHGSRFLKDSTIGTMRWHLKVGLLRKSALIYILGQKVQVLDVFLKNPGIFFVD